MADDALILAVTRAQAGDTHAFDYLVQKFQYAAIVYARSLLQNKTAAEDAAQEAFVQAWRDLPSLTQPHAFGAWLRRLVFKFCDRCRRTDRIWTPLADTLPLPKEQEPPSVAERAEAATQVRTALNALPDRVRAATFLYYLADYDVKEIAVFLDVSPSTVKNRLHAARKMLRMDLWTMAEHLLTEDKPAQSPNFGSDVLTRILAEFQQQESSDPHTVDRGLLEQGRSALIQRLEQDLPLDERMVHDGFVLLWRKQDWPALCALLTRYLAEPLSDSETAWAYLHLANTVGSAADAVLAHEAFERWAPGKRPCLSARWPYFPVVEDTASLAYIGEEVGLLFLHQSSAIGASYHGVWRLKDYLRKVDAALTQISATPRNCSQRFYALRMACGACETAGDWEGSQRYIGQMHFLAAEAEDETLRTDLECRAFGHEVNLAILRQDEAAVTTHAARMTALLDAAEQKGAGSELWVRAARHELSCHLVKSGRFEQALPLLDANAATGGQLGGWGWLIYAATVWQLTQDRERTLSLLREARAHDDRDLVPLFRSLPALDGVHNDADLIAAIYRGHQQDRSRIAC